MDFLKEMGYAGLTGRLKRLNDQFVYQTREFYKDFDVDIEPNWHMIFLLLEKKERMTVTEIAEALHLSHPAIIKLTKKMKQKSYLVSEKDPEDSRKHLLALSQKAKNKRTQLHEYWAAGNEALEEMLNHNQQLLDQLYLVEKNMQEADFKSRIIKHLNKNSKNA